MSSISQYFLEKNLCFMVDSCYTFDKDILAGGCHEIASPPKTVH